MALTRCPDCGREVSDVAPACPGCGRPIQAASPPVAAKKGGTTSGEVLGSLLFLGGVAGALYYYEFFKTTVETTFGTVNNLGLMQDRQNGLLISGGIAVVGLVLGIALRRR